MLCPSMADNAIAVIQAIALIRLVTEEQERAALLLDQRSDTCTGCNSAEFVHHVLIVKIRPAVRPAAGELHHAPHDEGVAAGG